METGKHDEVSYEHIAAFLNIFVYRLFIVAVQCGFRLASVSLCRGLNMIKPHPIYIAFVSVFLLYWMCTCASGCVGIRDLYCLWI